MGGYKLRKLFVVVFVLALVNVPTARAEVASLAFASNADNLTSGTVDTARLPVGSAENTVAAGDDVRFDTIAYGRPTGDVDSSRVLIWVE